MMASFAVDYSYDPPDPGRLAAAGVDLAVGYVSRPGHPKNFTRPHVDALHAHGVNTAVVFEISQLWTRGGREQGAADAPSALAQAIDLGLPGNRPIYFAVDYDTQPNDRAVTCDYFRGVLDVLPIARVGAYGSHRTIGWLFDAGLITYGWQTIGWSHGNRDPRAGLYQNGIQKSLAGGTVDFDDRTATDVGQWPTVTRPVLKIGDMGPAVRELQEALNAQP